LWNKFCGHADESDFLMESGIIVRVFWRGEVKPEASSEAGESYTKKPQKP
jgi:hypothetical protein